MSAGGIQPDPSFWTGKRVFVTGHTGFKGSWLCEWLLSLGATVRGFSLAPETTPNLFDVIELGNRLDHVVGDVRSAAALSQALRSFDPHVVFHLAAQPLVRRSYKEPIQTFEVNVLGTAHVLEACRESAALRSIVIVTTDKCYENREWVWGYRETDPVGGHDPYSASKACAELVTNSYRNSFFKERAIGITTARAGNVLGGGDWSEDRLIPDAIRAFDQGVPLDIRNPSSVRPWQHVVDPLAGYLILAERAATDPSRYQGAWNLGPDADSIVAVSDVISTFATLWGTGAAWRDTSTISSGPHEATLLSLDVSKARMTLGWRPRLSLESCLSATCKWYRSFYQRHGLEELRRQMSATFQSPSGQ